LCMFMFVDPAVHCFGMPLVIFTLFRRFGFGDSYIF
jgi:hypothetical protein